jgi:hypothetical protein
MIITKIAGIGHSLERCAGELLGHHPSKLDRTRIGDRLRVGLDQRALLPFNAFPGLTLGEHANGPRAHSVAIQGFQFEYRALEALARWR